MNDYPTLDTATHENWIDRLANMPEYAQDFYDWLVDNSTPTGVLANPENGELLQDGYYIHTVRDVEGSFTFEAGAGDNIGGVAQERANQVITEMAANIYAYIFAVLSAFDYDHPEVFFLGGTFRPGYTYGLSIRALGNNVTVSYTAKFYLTLKNPTYDIRAMKYRSVRSIAQAYSTIDNVVDDIIDGIPNGASEYEVLDYFNDWLTQNNSYNSSDDLNAIDHDCRECVSAFLHSSGEAGPVCEGYARAFKVLCDKVDIPCTLVTGMGYANGDSEPHMWNTVQMGDDKWYAVDVTWDDPVVKGSGNGVVSGYENDKWLLVGADTVIDGSKFKASHVMTNQGMGNICFTNTPDLASEKFDPNNIPEPEPQPEPVASVNGIEYYSLTEAIQNVNDGDTVYLLKTPADDDVPVVTRPMMLTLEYVNTEVNFDPYNDFVGGEGISYSFRGDPIIDDTDTVVLTFADLQITMDLGGGYAKHDQYNSFTAISGKNFKTPSRFWYNAPEGKKFGAWEINGEYYPHNYNIVLYEDVTIKAIWIDLDEHFYVEEGEILLDPTCTEPGIKEIFCYACNLNEQVEIPATGEHDAEWVLDTPAQLGVPGREVLLCEICGVIDEKVIPAISADFAEDVGDLRDVVLTEEEKQQVEAGSVLQVELKSEDISETVSQTEKDLIAEKVSAENVVIYLDIDLIKYIGNSDPIPVTETSAPIKVTVAVPEELIRDGAIYKVARIHDGVVDIIDGEFDPENKTFTFETDKFSTYALIVTDETEPAGVLGDVNGDTIVNSDDAVAILRHLAGYEVDGNIALGDYNSDGVTNSDDAVAILRMLAGYVD